MLQIDVYKRQELGKGRMLEDILAEMHMVAEGVKTASVALELAECCLLYTSRCV